MSHDSRITIEGTVREQLPSGLYRVEIEGAQRITAHVARGIGASGIGAGGVGGGGLEKNFVRLLVGDRVVIELTPRDLTRGRVVRKL